MGINSVVPVGSCSEILPLSKKTFVDRGALFNAGCGYYTPKSFGRYFIIHSYLYRSMCLNKWS